ncbi:hypothetical protein FTV88_0540 [Heliorestis convoluta]|uniref:Uncharacterized protein n=1 Tax=Heliorestis convoluta TaxID=356322 RepID=A0A5Q2MZ60_9FIRM|nr:hypothetical protein FTV88_0540 [Heliorestis convoluta]
MFHFLQETLTLVRTYSPFTFIFPLKEIRKYLKAASKEVLCF